ncbi:sulfur carrier protein ThiS [Bacillus sp. PS06]|uniref:sulfur carrier protein ThiS n=1 Tax=Bacillus sp. PS06 TaxID=2764176 RepID=UPI001786A57A|nr:sulfur carrier protein ThiS [Bacillus sp. PS06]MBD8067755.1 thiamine biosynthesis protein ThiS [Bacillus sp. PS06]
MELVINGDTVSLPDQIETVSSLLEHFGLAEKVVIVELNETILEKSEHQETRLVDRDRIEIVHFVGGG